MFTETHPVISPNAGTRNQSKHADTHPALMFHYPCLLVEGGCGEWCRCRNLPPFAAKCHLPTKMQHTAAICRILHFLLTDSPELSLQLHSRLKR